MANNQRTNQIFRFLFALLAIGMIFMFIQSISKKSDIPNKLDYSDFKKELTENKDNPITEISFHELGQLIKGERKNKTTFETTGIVPIPQKLLEQLDQQQIKYRIFEPKKTPFWQSLLTSLLIPVLLIGFLIFFFMRQVQGAGGKAMSFGKSKAKLHEGSKVTFDQIAGIEEAKAEVGEIIDFLKDPRKYARLGGRIPKGVLLIGPPGTGKTLLAKGIAGEAGVPFFSISGSDFVEMFVGVGASRVRDLFEQAKKNAPCIIFIDEIDAVGRHRGAGMGGGHDEREQTLNQLLVEMDGFDANEGVILVAATNRADVLDPALLRPGRFDRRVIVPVPDVRGREGILKVHTKNKPLAKEINLTKIAKGTPGFSGADLENLVNEAALIAARDGAEHVGMPHLELAKDKVLMGPERKSMVFGFQEKKVTAYHEAGHCIVAKSVPGADPVHKITIIPRGQALGVTILLPDSDRLSISKQYAEGMIKFAMGGKAAEEVVFNHQTTGAGDDLKKATDIARKIVCSWGMNEKIGPISLAKEGNEVFLGRDIGASKPYSEKLAEMIDEEIRNILVTCYKEAKGILIEKRAILESMSKALIVKEVLNSDEINRLMKGEIIVSDEEYDLYEADVKKALDAKEKKLEMDMAAQLTSGSDNKEDSSKKIEPVLQAT